MDNYQYNKLKAQVSVLKDVLVEYQTRSISNAIQQIESRIKFFEEHNKD